MSQDSHSSNSFAGKLGLVGSGLTALSIFVMLGIFGVRLLGAMFTNGQYMEDPAAESLSTGAPAAATSSAAPAAAKPAGGAAPPAAVPSASAEFAALGRTTFANCVACHGAQGKGPPMAMTPPMAPVLAGSELVNGPTEPLALILLKGVVPDMTRHSGAMMGWEASMSDEQIAAVITYIRMNFGNTGGPVSPEQIAWAREKYVGKPMPPRAEIEAVTAELPEDL
ncbi:MAG: cytochrome c [Verrucomicrobiota bacterium]